LKQKTKDKKILEFIDLKLCLCEYKLNNFEKSIFHSKRLTERKLENVRIECLCNVELNYYEEAMLNAIELYKKKEKDLNFYLSKIYKLENKKLNELKSISESRKIVKSNNRNDMINLLCDQLFKDDKTKINHQLESFGEKPKLSIFPSNQLYNQNWIFIDEFNLYSFSFHELKWDLLKFGLGSFLYTSFQVVEEFIYLFCCTGNLNYNRTLRLDIQSGMIESYLEPKESSKYTVNYTPKRRTNFSTIHLEGRIFIFGGNTEEEILNLIEEFNLESNKMRKISNVKVPALSNHSSNLWNDCMIIFGGVDSEKNSSNELYSLNLNDFQCEKILTIGIVPPKVRDHGSVIYGLNSLLLILENKLYICGGSTDGNDVNTLDCIFEFDLKLQYWRKIGNLVSFKSSSSLRFQEFVHLPWLPLKIICTLLEGLL
jgi:hypothetical protein